MRPRSLTDLPRRVEGLEALVKDLRSGLALEVTNGARPESLATSLNRVAEAEGRLFVYRSAEQFVVNATAAAEDGADDVSGADVRDHLLTSVVLRGPDDGWSGRTNDARRAYFDGVLDAVRDFEYLR